VWRPPRRYFVVLSEDGALLLSLELPVPELDEGALLLSLELPVPELEPVLLWCLELFVLLLLVDGEEPEPLASSLLVPDRPLAVPLELSDEPVEPLMPPVVPLEPIEPPAPEVVSLGLVEPVLDGELAPVPLDEAPVELEPVPLDEAPVELMSIILAVSPEKEARTCAPSWRSERLALEPSFVTFVLWSTLSCLSLPASDRVLLC
jgi:hypothetical protein